MGVGGHCKGRMMLDGLGLFGCSFLSPRRACLLPSHFLIVYQKSDFNWTERTAAAFCWMQQLRLQPKELALWLTRVAVSSSS